MRNLLLEFLNREVRRFYGLSGMPPDRQREILGRWINIAAWLCDEYCIIPTGFVLEDQLVKDVLEARSGFLDCGLLQMPMRAAGLENFVRKRREEYRPFAADYPGIFGDETAGFIEQHGNALKDRMGRSGESLVSKWEKGSEFSPLWNLVRNLGPKKVAKLAGMPAEIRKSEAAIVWNAIDARLENDERGFSDELRRILLSGYVDGYCEEYNLETIHGLPWHWRNLRPLRVPPDCVDYASFQTVFKPIGLLNVVECIDAEALIQIRGEVGYATFIKAFEVASSHRKELKVAMAVARPKLVSRVGQLLSGVQTRAGIAYFNSDAVQILCEILAFISEDLTQLFTAEANTVEKRPVASSSTRLNRHARIAVFVALREEREVLARSELQFSKTEHDHILVARRNDVQIDVYCAERMGRVAAAVATMAYLHERGKPDLILVVGIAGGFEKEGVKVGALLVPDEVIDLGIRKIFDDRTSFRPRPFPLQGALLPYLRSNTFEERRWAEAAHEFLEWPNDARPHLRLGGPITSVDEVVSSIEHSDDLRAAYPKLAGVEMEAGGICAAAEAYGGVPVSVLRGVSDKADPSKADDEWRKRVMKTIAHLLASLDIEKMLRTGRG